MATEHARVSTPLEWGIALRAFMGQDESGDAYLVDAWGEGALVVVVDGLGHGPRAAAVGRAAVAALEGQTRLPIDLIFKHCHKKLLGTRGVVMSAASFNALNGTMTWAGVGNVMGVLLRADDAAERPRESLLVRGGVLGYQLPNLYPAILPVVPNDILVFATDGLRSGFAEDLPRHAPAQQIAEHILENYGRGTDDALVLVARYLGREETGAA